MESSSNQVRSHVSLKPTAMAGRGISNIIAIILTHQEHSLILFNLSESL